MEKQSKSFSEEVSKRIAKVKEYLQGPESILSVIKEDHKPLKELIKVMKDGDRKLEERVQAASEFIPLLITHAKAEEQSLYEYMKTKKELREFGFEGDTEHMVADQLAEEISRTNDNDALGARIKVLAELVEHHIQEEENDMFPVIEKASDKQTLESLTEKYVDVQSELIAQGQDDSPSEADLSREDLKH